VKVLKDLRANVKVTRGGNTVHFHTHATLSVADVAKLLLDRIPMTAR
jgi:hypothetical protein